MNISKKWNIIEIDSLRWIKKIVNLKFSFELFLQSSN